MIFNILGNSNREFTLCETCLYSHVVMNGAETKFTGCFVGGVLREVKFAVTDCSTYFDRAKRRISNCVEGFIRKPTLGSEIENTAAQ